MFFSRINAAVKLSAEQEKQQENELDKKEKKDQLKSSLLKAAKKAEREARHLRSIDPSTRSFPFKQYIIACNYADFLVKTEFFQNLVFLAIVTAGILVGAQTYPGVESIPAIIIMDFIILLIFSTELVCKIMSEGMEPLQFFVGSEWTWNNFDFFIVMFSMPFIPFANGQIAFLRLIRLMRLAKVFRKVPQLRMIMTGLIGGLKSIIYIVILLLLVFYLYAIAGIFFFRVNDPWHFNSIAISLITLFGVATLSNWSDIFYINYYGCAYYSGGNYVLYKEDLLSEANGSPLVCTPKAQPALSLAYFVSFIFICSFSMLSLFVGAITVSMSESMQTMKAEKEKRNKLSKLKKAEQNMVGEVKDRKERRAWALVQMAFNDGKVEVVAEDMSHLHKWVQGYKSLARKCEELSANTRFQNFVTLVIIIAGVEVGLGTDLYLSNLMHDEIVVVDFVIRTIFTIEAIIKIIAEDLTPWKYFNNNWNTFDFMVVVGSYVSGGGSIIVMLRLLRLLRVLKLMRMLPQLQIIVSALMSGFSSITFISVILVLFFYFFGIIAMILFGTNDPWHFGTLHMTMITLFQCATLDNWTDVLYINLFGCDVIGYEDMPHLCTNPGASFIITSAFFVIFILMGALVLLTLFIGVVATSMEEATDDQKLSASVDTRVAELAKSNDINDYSIMLYREVFDALDLNGGNQIDQNELKLGMKAAGRTDITDKQFLKLWRQVDKDGSGGIDFAEFLFFMLSLRDTKPEKVEIAVADEKVAATTHAVAEQLYNVATAVGPIDATMKTQEMINKTSTGRPSSAPRVLNRGYSIETEKKKPQVDPEIKKSLSQRALNLLRTPSQRVHPVGAIDNPECEVEDPSLCSPPVAADQEQKEGGVDSPQHASSIISRDMEQLSAFTPKRLPADDDSPLSIGSPGKKQSHKHVLAPINAHGQKVPPIHPSNRSIEPRRSPDDRDNEINAQKLSMLNPAYADDSLGLKSNASTKHRSPESKKYSPHQTRLPKTKKVISKVVFV